MFSAQSPKMGFLSWVEQGVIVTPPSCTVPDMTMGDRDMDTRRATGWMVGLTGVMALGAVVEMLAKFGVL